MRLPFQQTISIWLMVGSVMVVVAGAIDAKMVVMTIWNAQIEWVVSDRSDRLRGLLPSFLSVPSFFFTFKKVIKFDF